MRMKKQVLSVVCMLVMLVATACAGKASETGSAAADTPITADWEVYSWTKDGVTSYREDAKDLEQVPTFETSDGVNFLFTITGETTYDGTITKNDDGSYTLKHGDNPNELTAKIEGDTLTIWISEQTTIVFKEKK